MTNVKLNSQSAETLAKWYLRFNGYFLVDNFIVHARDDPNRISNGKVGNHAEMDILAVRYKFSKEITGNLSIKNDPQIINPVDSKIDFVIAEVKTGRQAKPNKLWTEKRISVIQYILRFAGFIESESSLKKIAETLADKGSFDDEDGNFSIRLVLISEIGANRAWKHVKNVLFDDIINFLVEVRGQCWVNEDIGTASIQYQWDDLIIKIFNIANNQAIEIDEQKHLIKRLLQENQTVKVINIDKEILGGTPVFDGTRVPIKNLFDYLETGDTIDSFSDDFPSVKREQIVKLLEFSTLER